MPSRTLSLDRGWFTKDYSSEDSKPDDKVEKNCEPADQVDGLSPGFGFTPETEKYLKFPKREDRGHNNNSAQASSNDSPDCVTKVEPTCSNNGELRSSEICKCEHSLKNNPTKGGIYERIEDTNRNLPFNKPKRPQLNKIRLQRRNTFPTPKFDFPVIQQLHMRWPCLSQDRGLEKDAIITQHTHVRQIDFRKLDISETSFFKYNPKIPKKQPDQTKEIIIPHKYATDTEYGDIFGARLASYNKKPGKGTFNQHVFVDVTSDGPADKMKIQNKDELLIINGEFVPVLDHTAVLNLFHKVKVDGITRLIMVVRRKGGKDKAAYKFQWYETSAVLAADKPSIEMPDVQRPEYKELPNNGYELKHWFRFKIQDTPNYLDITATGVSVGPLTNNLYTDRTKSICQRMKYSDDEYGKFMFMSTLCDHNQMFYITLDMTNDVIVVPREPRWFQYNLIGHQVSFNMIDTSTYIAFDESERKLRGAKEEYLFLRYGLPHEADAVDTVD